MPLTWVMFNLTGTLVDPSVMAQPLGDSDLAGFFRRAQGESRKGAEQGKDLLRARLSS